MKSLNDLPRLIEYQGFDYDLYLHRDRYNGWSLSYALGTYFCDFCEETAGDVKDVLLASLPTDRAGYPLMMLHEITAEDLQQCVSHMFEWLEKWEKQQKEELSVKPLRTDNQKGTNNE